LFGSNPLPALQQTAKLQNPKEKRKQGRVHSSLKALCIAAEGMENMMLHFIEAVTAYATIGEICGVLREIFGVYTSGETKQITPCFRTGQTNDLAWFF
jgi:methylmalonyl-CoA mutase N-terminal domain/subunit